MENIVSVTQFLAGQAEDPRETMTVIFTDRGDSFYTDETGHYRVYEFVEGTICLQAAETPEDFYQSAVGFGRFQKLLSQFPAETLHEAIPNFHNTIDRYRIFHETLSRDPMGRAKDVEAEIAFVLAREEEAGTLQRMRLNGQLPLRVTHNDTKLNNVLLDEHTRKALCVIDLDTVMPGLSLYDFGDSIRFGAATAAEDEKDLSKMTIDLELFRIFTKGFLSSCDLTEEEIRLLPLGAKTMTLECGLRFLTDYLDGDHYFAVHREGHNLDRCRTQFKLVSEMEQHWGEMGQIVQDIVAELS
jgi:Ser/Thr protein kinase RdoA (MazF antagonist)